MTDTFITRYPIGHPIGKPLCGSCKGSGRGGPFDWYTCTTCNGRGFVERKTVKKQRGKK